MKSKLSKTRCKQGFTLIELLVVVLIISILAAVALPQYNKAVKKAQGREVYAAIDALDKSLRDYYLEHGDFIGISEFVGSAGGGQWIKRPITHENLNIQIPTLKHFWFIDGEGNATRSFEQGKFSNIFDKTGYVVRIVKDANDFSNSADVSITWNPTYSPQYRKQMSCSGNAFACAEYFEGTVETQYFQGGSSTSSFYFK